MPRIVIVRLSAIGDVMHGLPVACALRDTLPDAEIGWVVEGRAADLLAGHRAIDHLVRVPRKWLKSPAEAARLRRTLRAFAPQVAIDVQGLTKSAVAARLSGARRRIGFDGVDGREFSRWLNNELVLPTATHVVDRNLQLLQPLGIEETAVRFDLPGNPADETFAEQCVSQHGNAGRFAIINPSAGWPSKRWPPERFGQVACHLGHRHQMPTLVVWAGEQEHRMAETIVETSSGHARLAPPTSLTGLVALCRRASLFVSADTGPLHVAVAAGARAIGLFGPVPHQRNGPYGPGNLSLQKATLGGGSRQRRNASNETMLAIQVQDACSACDQILATARNQRRTA